MEEGSSLIITLSVGGWIIVLLASAAGWFATYRLTVHAQNKAFHNQLLNEARLEVMRAIREYENWLSRVCTKIEVLNVYSLIWDGIRNETWLKQIREVLDLFWERKAATNWVHVMIDHESLIPGTAGCREFLCKRADRIRELVRTLSDGLVSNDVEHVRISIQNAQGGTDIIFHQIGLLHDLRVHIQNKCLSSIIGRTAPEREPEDPTAPRIVADKDGNLQVFEPMVEGVGEDRK